MAAVALAAALLIGGALGPFRPEASPGRTAAPRVDQAALVTGGGNLDATIASLQARLRAAPDDWRSLASLGLAYTTKARVSADPSYYPKAEGLLQRSLDINDSENFQALLGMGALAVARHDFAGGLMWARKAKAINPYNAQIRGVIGDAYTELGRYDDAIGAFQSMVDLRPDLSSFARVSYARELHGDVKGALAAMRMALDAAQGDPSDAAWVGYQLGELHFNSGDLGSARRSYRRCRYLDPDSVLCDAGMAKVLAARGELARAARLMSRVVKRYPSAEHVIALGDMYTVMGAAERADAQYDLVAAIEQLYRSNGVNVDLEQALFDADHDRDLRRGLKVARAEYRRRDSVHVADALAWTLYATGDYRHARHYSQRALRLGTRSALFHFHAGMIAFELDRDGEARSHLGRALKINPAFSLLHADEARATLRAIEVDR